VTRGREITLDLAQHRLCARTAKLYYESELTQAEIGETLGLSRMRVNRLLTLARDSGVVDVRITSPKEPFGELQHELLTALRLQDVRITPTPPSADALRSTVTAAAAGWLEERLEVGLVVGLGLGRTVALLPETFSPRGSVSCTFVTVEGVGTSPNAGFAAYNVTTRLADAVGGTAVIVSAPTFVSDANLRDRLLSEPSVSATLDVARGADVVIQSVGTVTDDALLYHHGTLDKSDLRELRAVGAIGDALGHYFDADGKHVPFRTDDVHIGLTLDDLRKLPTSVLVAGGRDKVQVIHAAIKGGYFNVLVTDSETATQLLAMST